MEPIRVLCVFSTLDRGGAEAMCMNLYRHIDRTKVQFDFVKHTPERGAYEDEIEALGGKIYEAPRYLINNHIAYTNWWKKHLREHPEHKVVHGHFFGISSVYFKVAKQFNCITIGHSHCTQSSEFSIKECAKAFLIKKIEEYADYCFACSQPAGEWIYKHKDFKVLNNAIDSELFRFRPELRCDIRKKLYLEDSFVVGTVGRIMYQKNPDGIIDIFAAIKKHKPNARLMWIGNGPDREKAEEKLRALGLSDSVLMLGVRSDVNELYQAMDAFIFPSNYEGLGIVAVEAQAAGLHCFCSDQVPEEANVTGNCTFLPLGDAELWADTILSTDLSRKDTQQQIVDAGYDIHTTAKWLEEFYLKCADR